MNKIVLKIGGMNCSACSSGLEKYLNKQEGIKEASVNLVLSNAFIEYDDNVKYDDLSKFIKEAGFECLGIYNPREENNNHKKNKHLLIIYSFLTLLTLYISMSHMVHLPVIPFLHMINYPINYSVCLFILTIFFLIYGFDIIKSGYKNLIHKTPNMDTLVSIGVLASFLYSTYGMIKVILGNYDYVENLYFESCTMVIFFIKLGRFIDTKSKEKTSEAIKELVTITPSKAIIKSQNKEIEVTIDEIKKGDILIAKEGTKIAVDGIIVKGESHLDEAFITGESIPVKKKVGDKVVAGSMNKDGYLEYQAQKIGKDSTISEIVRLVIEASNTKVHIAKLADKASGYFVPTIIFISLITLLFYLLLGYNFSDSINAFVTVLVVACPCALGLATPLAIVISSGLSAKGGILVKNSEILEKAKDVDTVIFDKTGTLTYGNLKISKILNYSNYSDEELLTNISSIEVKSSHPISSAFNEYVKEHKIDLINVYDFITLPGIGLKGKVNNQEIYLGNNKLFSKLEIDNKYMQDEKKLTNLGNSIVYVIENKQVIGLIGVKDIVRKSAKKIVAKLQKRKIDVMMLTGDNEVTAKIIADGIGIKRVIANVYPKDKVNVINKLINDKKTVMMVGDGINDAPSLATANIGVSVNSGTDIAANSSDVIIMNDNLEKIVDLITISYKTIRNIKQNLFWAFFYNVCMIPLAIGLLKPFSISLNPMIASFFMTISSLTVIFNSLRLKRIKLEKGEEYV